MKQPTGSPIIQIKPISFFFSSCGNSRSFYGRKLTLFHDTERIFIYKNFKRNNIDVDFVNSFRVLFVTVLIVNGFLWIIFLHNEHQMKANDKFSMSKLLHSR